MSILKSTLALEPKSRFFLFYGNRGFEHIIFREELEMLKNRYPDRFAIYHVLSREALPAEIFCGRLSADKCRSYAMRLFDPAEVDAFFLCGPEQMVLELRETLEKDLAVPAKRIHIELFNAPSVQRKITKVANPTFTAAVTVIQDGYEFDFELPDKGSSLLDAAMRAGADLPFSCKGGVCCTCKAKVLEGAVDMDINYGLEPDEIEAGYILTCQSHPKTERLVVSFDE